MSPDEALTWKLRLFSAGAVLLVLGMLLQRPAFVLASIVLLGAGILVRLAQRRGSAGGDAAPPGEDPPAER